MIRIAIQIEPGNRHPWVSIRWRGEANETSSASEEMVASRLCQHLMAACAECEISPELLEVKGN
jgi:hypothetical protein